jgi:hypothetical protein
MGPIRTTRPLGVPTLPVPVVLAGRRMRAGRSPRASGIRRTLSSLTETPPQGAWARCGSRSAVPRAPAAPRATTGPARPIVAPGPGRGSHVADPRHPMPRPAALTGGTHGTSAPTPVSISSLQGTACAGSRRARPTQCRCVLAAGRAVMRLLQPAPDGFAVQIPSAGDLANRELLFVGHPMDPARTDLLHHIFRGGAPLGTWSHVHERRLVPSRCSRAVGVRWGVLNDRK